jgi:hypothetical protein
MKNSIYTLLILLLFSCKSQQAFAQYSMQNLTPFIGTWEYQEGNQIFRVIIYEDDLYLKGDYSFVEVNNGVETIICESNYYIPEINRNSGHTIFGGSNDGIIMGASIDDNTINCESGITERKRLKGNLGFTIQQQNCPTCPITAEWKVERWQGLRSDTEPNNYSIPTNVIMTKVE